MDTNKKRIVAGILIISLFLGGTGTVFASNDALPGEGLYPLKRAVERAQVSLALTDGSRAEIEFEHATERLREVTALRQREGASTDETEQVKLRERVQAASDDTSIEIEQAFLSLSRVHASLSEKGNTQAASAIEDNINRLVDDSRQARFEVRVENEGGVERVRVRLSDSDSDGDSREDFQGRGRGSDDSSSSRSSSGAQKSNSDTSSSTGSSSNSAPAVGTADLQERASEVFCRGEWRDPSDCRGTPEATPPANTGSPSLPSVDATRPAGDIQERPDQVLCDGEWRDPEDCARR